MSRSPSLAALALAVAACELEPCPKDQVLRADQVPCDCQGAIVTDVSCGSVTCTAHGLAGTTIADTGCTTASNTTTTTTP